MPEENAIFHTLIAGRDEAGGRLDRFLTARLPEMSRRRLQALIAQGHVTAGDRAITDAAAKVRPGQEYRVAVPEAAPSRLLPQALALDILYEDAHMLILNKPPGLTVHPAPGHPDRTLVNALLAHCGDSLSGIGGVARPGIVHRIDKDTSGLLAVAKHDAAHRALSAQLSGRTMKRVYLALAWGVPGTSGGTITGNIGRSPANRQKMAVVKTGGKPAVTHYKVVASDKWQVASGKWSLLECRLETGRTHQIRVHLAHIGHPLVGDPAYGQPTSTRLKAGGYKTLPPELREALTGFRRQALHARTLELNHPATGEKMAFTCDPPEDMKKLIATLL